MFSALKSLMHLIGFDAYPAMRVIAIIEIPHFLYLYNGGLLERWHNTFASDALPTALVNSKAAPPASWCEVQGTPDPSFPVDLPAK